MTHVIVWVVSILLYGILFWKIGLEIWEDSKMWFIILSLLCLMIPTSVSFMILDHNKQIDYIKQHKCAYAQKTNTSIVPIVTIVNNTTLVNMVETTSYLWNCPDGQQWFSVVPGE